MRIRTAPRMILRSFRAALRRRGTVSRAGQKLREEFVANAPVVILSNTCALRRNTREANDARNCSLQASRPLYIPPVVDFDALPSHISFITSCKILLIARPDHPGVVFLKRYRVALRKPLARIVFLQQSCSVYGVQ